MLGTGSAHLVARTERGTFTIPSPRTFSSLQAFRSGFSLPFTFIVDAPALCTRCARAVFVIRWSDAIVIRGTSKRLKIRSRYLSSFRLISHSNFIYCRENKFNGIITRSPSITSPLCGEFYFQTIALRE